MHSSAPHFIDTERLVLRDAVFFTLRHLPFLAPLTLVLSFLLSGLSWLLFRGSDGEALLLDQPLLSRLSTAVTQFFLPACLLALGLVIGFILTALALRQLSRSDHLKLSHLMRGLEADLWPMLQYGFYVVRRRYPVFLLSLLPCLGLGATPIGGIGLLLDLFYAEGVMKLADLALGLLCLAILYWLMPFVFLAYHMLFHEADPAKAEPMVFKALHGHRGRIFGALLLAALPYYLADELLFYVPWHPVIKHMIGVFFAIPMITTAYLFYLRIEAGTLHPQD